MALRRAQFGREIAGMRHRYGRVEAVVSRFARHVDLRAIRSLRCAWNPSVLRLMRTKRGLTSAVVAVTDIVPRSRTRPSWSWRDFRPPNKVSADLSNPIFPRSAGQSILFLLPSLTGRHPPMVPGSPDTCNDGTADRPVSLAPVAERSEPAARHISPLRYASHLRLYLSPRCPRPGSTLPVPPARLPSRAAAHGLTGVRTSASPGLALSAKAWLRDEPPPLPGDRENRAIADAPARVGHRPPPPARAALDATIELMERLADAPGAAPAPREAQRDPPLGLGRAPAPPAALRELAPTARPPMLRPLLSLIATVDAASRPPQHRKLPQAWPRASEQRYHRRLPSRSPAPPPRRRLLQGRCLPPQGTRRSPRRGHRSLQADRRSPRGHRRFS